jgi:hypothetical protein
MNPSRRLSVIALLVAFLAAHLPPAGAEDVLAVSPTSLTFSENVATPGSGWTFNRTAAWLPAGWNNAYTYHTNGCVMAHVTGNGNSPWTLNAYYAATPGAPVNVALAQAGANSCGTPAIGTPISASRLTPLASGRGDWTLDFYVVVQPTVIATAPVGVTVVFTVSGGGSGAAVPLAITMSPRDVSAATIAPSAARFAENLAAPRFPRTVNQSW